MRTLKVPLGRGYRVSGCANCGEVFTSLSGFDRHWQGARGGNCRHPSEAGLHQRQDGKWSIPARSGWTGP